MDEVRDIADRANIVALLNLSNEAAMNEVRDTAVVSQGLGEMVVTDKNGRRAVFELQPAPVSDDGQQRLLARLEDGQQVLIPAELLVERQTGGYFLPVSLASLIRTPTVPLEIPIEKQVVSSPTVAPPSVARTTTTEELVLPVLAEEARVEKQTVATGVVRINKRVLEREETIDEPLTKEEISVEHVVVDRFVDAPPPVRYIGDTTIIPLLEEVLVVEKRLRLKEEIHITRRRVETRQPQQVTLRSEEVTVERDSAPAAAAPTSHSISPEAAPITTAPGRDSAQSSNNKT